MTRLRVALLIAVFAFLPRTVSAGPFGWWEWLENLEGPGPWNGAGIGIHGPTIGSRDRPFFQAENVADHLLELRVAWLRTTNRQRYERFAGDEAPVQMIQVQPLYRFRTPLRMLDVGAGGGFLALWGDGIDATKPTASVNISFLPLQFLDPDRPQRLRWLKVEYEPLYVFKGFTGAEFGNAAARPLPAEWVQSLNVVIDFGNLREALR